MAGPSSMITTRRSPPPNNRRSPKDNHMELNSILRIRPLRGKEKEDHVVLEKANAKTNPNMAVLHPIMHLTSPDAKGPTLDFIEHGKEREYHFDKILDISASQESVFYAIGLNMVNTAMEPLKKTTVSAKSQVLVAMGMPHAGKSYTTFGGKARFSRNGDDGLVPRMLDSLYSQSKHHIAGNKVFGISIKLIHIYKDQVTDLLVEPQKPLPSNNKTRASTVRAMVASFETNKTTNDQTQVRIDQDGVTGDFVVHTSSKICRDAVEARELIATGMSRSQGSKLANLVKTSSKGHVVITLQPVLTVRHEVERYGGIITIVDMAGEDKNKVSQRSSSNNAMRDAIGPTSSSGAVLHCLSSMQHNQNIKAGKAPAIDFRCGDDDSLDGSDISNVSETKSGTNKSPMTVKAVPFRQSLLTMVLQPLFAHKGTTLVTLLMAAYPGHRDYADKRSLLNDLENLQGVEVAKRTIQLVDTGLVGGGRVYRAATPIKESESGSDDDLVLSDDDKESDISAGDISFEPLPPPVVPSAQAVAPRAHTPVFNNINDLPGVTIPGTVRPSAPVVVAVFAPSALEQSPVASAPSAPLFDSPVVPKSSSVYMPSPPMNPNYRPASPMRATVSADPVIRPPVENFESHYVGISNSPPHRNWMTKSPLKTITSAVNSTKKKGMKAFEKMEKMVPERMSNFVVAKRLSHEFEPDVPQSAMMKRIKELEDQNARFLEHNSRLGQKCDELQEANNRLVRSLKQADKYGRRAGWTEQDEVEWEKSRRKQLDAQQLIRSPLREHLKNVQTTYEINNRWTDAGKPHFSLDYPKQWRRARELDERDRSAPQTQPEPIPSSFVPSRLRMQPSQIGEKRKSSECERTSMYVKSVGR